VVEQRAEHGQPVPGAAGRAGQVHDQGAAGHADDPADSTAAGNLGAPYARSASATSSSTATANTEPPRSRPAGQPGVRRCVGDLVGRGVA
jgi:hypothetical protein